MEGHTVVDNHETTDELFSAAIKQCFDDLNESLEEKVTNFYFADNVLKSEHSC